MILMRGCTWMRDGNEEGGTILFYFDLEGRAIGLDLYREWIGPTLEPGVEYRVKE